MMGSKGLVPGIFWRSEFALMPHSVAASSGLELGFAQVKLARLIGHKQFYLDTQRER
jgi:hypothetical protein